MKIYIENKKAYLHFENNLISPNIRELINIVQNQLFDETSFDSIEIDLCQSTSIDSLGITLLIGIYKTYSSQNKPITLVGVNEPMMELFKIMKLNELFNI